MTTDNHQKIDLSRLGFEIHVTARSNDEGDSSSNKNCSKDLLLDNCVETLHDEDLVAPARPTGYSSGSGHNIPDAPPTPFGACREQDCSSHDIQSDDVSDICDETDDDSDGDADDDEKECNRPTRARQLNNHRYRPGLQMMSYSTLVCEEEYLGYEPLSTIPSPRDLGYGGDEPVRAICHDQLGYREQEDIQYNNTIEARRSFMKRMSSKRSTRNRRSMSIGMGARRLSRRSTCSGTTASSKSSYRSGKMSPSLSKKGRPSHRERLVTRSSSRRLSHKHPCPVRVVRTATNETHRTAASNADDSDIGNDIYHSNSGAYHQTLQDLGCSELFLDPSLKLQQRIPCRISLEYGIDGCDSVASSRRPKSVCLEFGASGNSNSNRRRGSLASSCSGMMPHRVSIEYHQTCDYPDTGHGISTNGGCPSAGSTNRRVLSRRGYLNYSVGTSTLPRRASFGMGHVAEALQQEQNNASARSSCPRRRATMSGNDTTATSHHPPRSISIPSRNNSDSTNASSSAGAGSFSSRWASGSALGLGRVTHRSSIAHIPRKQISSNNGQGVVGVGTRGIVGSHQLTIKQVGGIEYHTREAVSGRWA